jgi:hypothetical protein
MTSLSFTLPPSGKLVLKEIAYTAVTLAGPVTLPLYELPGTLEWSTPQSHFLGIYTTEEQNSGRLSLSVFTLTAFTLTYSEITVGSLGS